MRPEHWRYTIPLRLRSLFRRAQADQELEEELRDHLERKTEEYAAQRMTQVEAHRRARLDMGGIEQTKEKCREARTVNWIQDLIQDLRFGLRVLRKNPGFTAVAVLTVALGIGASTAIFSIMDAVLLRPLPYSDSGKLVTVAESAHPNDVAGRFPVSPADFQDFRDQNNVFEQIGAYFTPGFELTGTDQPEQLPGAIVSASILPMLGVHPILGRGFSSADDRPGAQRVVLMSYRLWQRRFHGDRAVIGKTISLEGVLHTTIGVTPANFRFPGGEADLWVPLESELKPENLQSRGSHYLNVLAKLKQSVTIDQARVAMNRVSAVMKLAHPDADIGGAVVLSLKDEIVREIRPAILVLMAAVGCLLLIACANVANLFLARARAREKEISLRAALGASQGRVSRQLITESLLLSVCGGAVGILLAHWSRSILVAMSPDSLPQINPINTNFRTLVFAFMLSTITGVLFGLAPVFKTSRMNLHEILKSGGAGIIRGAGNRPRNVLMVGEVALSLVLLIAAGLLIESFVRLLRVDTGFRANRVITMRVGWLPEEKYKQDRDVAEFYENLLERVSILPGVVSAGATSYLPLTGHNFDNAFTVEGQPPLPSGVSQSALMRMVDPHYFQVVGIPLERGRIFNDRDHSNSAPVAIISQSVARRYWPGTNAVGKHMTILWGENSQPREVVGIVGDVRSDINADPEPTMYIPYQQFPVRSMVLTVKAQGDPRALVEEVRRAVREQDSDELLSEIQTPAELMAESVVPWRFSMLLVGSFATLALLLATVGIFAVVSYTVGERTHEIGVRMALGGRRGDILKLILGQSCFLLLIGLGIGLVAALSLTKLMSSLLYGVGPTDALTYVAVPVLLALVALFASYVPARRAMGVDPIVSLRYE